MNIPEEKEPKDLYLQLFKIFLSMVLQTLEENLELKSNYFSNNFNEVNLSELIKSHSHKYDLNIFTEEDALNKQNLIETLLLLGNKLDLHSSLLFTIVVSPFSDIRHWIPKYQFSFKAFMTCATFYFNNDLFRKVLNEFLSQYDQKALFQKDEIYIKSLCIKDATQSQKFMIAAYLLNLIKYLVIYKKDKEIFKISKAKFLNILDLKK